MLCRDGRVYLAIAFTAALTGGCWPARAATLRHVSALPDPALAGYWELSGRLGWRATSSLEIALSGTNLLHSRHLELPVPYGEYIGRSVFLRLDWGLQ